MMKTILLVIYLTLSLALPLMTIFMSHSKQKLKLVLLGLAIYVVGALPMMALTSINTLLYVVSSVILLFVGIFVMMLFFGMEIKDEEAMTVYGGFAILNVFFETMIPYVPLVFLGLYNDVAILSGYFGIEYASMMVESFNSIDVLSIVFAIFDMIACFYLLRIIFVRLSVLKDKRSILEFVIIYLVMRLVRYFVPVVFLRFGIDAILFVLMLHYYAKTFKPTKNSKRREKKKAKK